MNNLGDDIYKDVYKEANEVKSTYGTDEEQLRDKALFVENLGRLINQTRERVIALELIDEDTVNIKYAGDSEIKVNIACDSYMAIISDVIKAIKY